MLTVQQQKMLTVMGTTLTVDPRPLADPMAARFAEDLQSDSLDIVGMVMDLEEAFGIRISDPELESLEGEGVTVGKVWDIIAPKLSAETSEG